VGFFGATDVGEQRHRLAVESHAGLFLLLLQGNRPLAIVAGAPRREPLCRTLVRFDDDLAVVAIHEERRTMLDEVHRILDITDGGDSEPTSQDCRMTGGAAELVDDADDVAPVELESIGRQQLAGHQNRAGWQRCELGLRSVAQMSENAVLNVAEIGCALAQILTVGVGEYLHDRAQLSLEGGLDVDQLSLDAIADLRKELLIPQERQMCRENL
jgi:hypothetical protein